MKKNFKIVYGDISALEHAYALKNRMKGLFLTLIKMDIQIFEFSKFSDNLGIKSEPSHSSSCTIFVNEKTQIGKTCLNVIKLIILESDQIRRLPIV